jgi:salicylate 5-hydroxylase small subunit
MTDLAALQLQFALDQANAHYAAALDDARFEDWPNCFVAHGRYTLQSRENFDRNLPLALMDLESQAMMRDRVYYMRHIISPARVVGTQPDDAYGQVISSHTNYAVFRTKPGGGGGASAGISEAYNVGCYIDQWVQCDGFTLLLSRRAVYDSELVLNSLIYPV